MLNPSFIPLSAIEDVCKANKDFIRCFTEAEIGILTKAFCNRYFHKDHVVPEFKDRTMSLFWERLSKKIDSFTDETKEREAPKIVKRHVEVKAQIVCTTAPVEQPEVDDQTDPELTNKEKLLYRFLVEARDKYGVSEDGCFTVMATELRKYMLSDGRVFKASRDALVERGIIKYDHAVIGSKRRTRYWILKENVVEAPVEVTVEEPEDTTLTDDEQTLLRAIENSKDRRTPEGYFRAPVIYLTNATGLGYHQIALCKDSLQRKGYINYKLADGRYHFFKLLKNNYNKTA